MNKHGQAESIIIFFVLVIAIFIVSVVILKLVNTIVTPFTNQIGNVSASAGGAVTYAQNKFTGVWDTAIIILFFINVLLLLVSAFLVDVHPAFVIVYIFAVIFMFIFGNSALYALDGIWDAMAPVGSLEASQSPLQIFVINHFQIIMIGIFVLSGILMYAKFKFFQQGSGTGGSY